MNQQFNIKPSVAMYRAKDCLFVTFVDEQNEHRRETSFGLNQDGSNLIWSAWKNVSVSILSENYSTSYKNYGVIEAGMDWPDSAFRVSSSVNIIYSIHLDSIKSKPVEPDSSG